MNKALKIVSTGSFIPSKVMTNFDIEKLVETNDEWITSRTGIKERRICEEEDTTFMTLEASKKAIEEAQKADPNFSVDKIGALLVGTSSADYRLPSTACLLQTRLGISEKCLCYDLTAACSGFVYGLHTATGLLNTFDMEYALVVGCDKLSKITDWSDRSTCILFADGAGACIVKLVKSDVPYCGKAYSRGDSETLYCKEDGFIHMEGQAVYKFATKVVGATMEEIFHESGLGIEDIDHVVLHQANARIIEHVVKKYKGFENKFYTNIEKYGNTSAGSIPVALDEMNRKGLIKAGEKILCVGFGGGLTWGGVLVTA